MAADDTSRADQSLHVAWPDTALVDLRQISLLVWFRRRMILLVTAVALLASVAYLVVTPPTFVAEAVLLIDPQQPNITPSANVVDSFGEDAAMIESQVEVILSRQLLVPVFETLGLASDPEFAPAGLLSQLLAAFTGIAPAPKREDAYERF